MAAASREAGVPVVTGDTKVVEQGKADGVFITTTGVGVVMDGVDLSGANVRPGDVILLSGSMGDHGMAIMSRRENLAFDVPIESDTAALHHLIAAMLETGADIRCLRDPTRGGLATTLNEIAKQSCGRHDDQRGGHSGEAGSRRRMRISRPRSACTSPTKAS